MSMHVFADSHDPFWPRVELARLRALLARRGSFSEAALDVAARYAVIDAASEFALWRAALRKRGYKRLEDVSGHHHGRALQVCYVKFVEATIMRNVCGMAARVVSAGGASHA
ncbi:head completion/stabilization protein [Pseudomonas fakonensis]|uniref:Head completion/stabilization protein n=1 Tax=Pseudomonas fakonensis TaxID=2842355 RepID=A0ABX8N191_9PSED|nr:head completion/stabilization protein [Pseudomonas fakonensis]QXH49754.1 head completion/stabilization protein [Pseudomonas fakonensis]